MILLTLLSTFTLSAYAQSRYILANYSIPDFENDPASGNIVNSLNPFPIGSCVVYKAELYLLGILSGNLIAKYYGKFECETTNTTDDTVIFTDYGEDSTCMTQDNTNDYTYYPKAASGNEGDFSCSGSDNYVSIQAWVIGEIGDDNGGAACCDDYTSGLGVVTSTYATGVCFDSGNGYYSMAECNATQTQTSYFSDSACTQATTPASNEASFGIGLTDATSDYCQLLSTDDSAFDLSLYGIMSECVIDGNTQSFDDYCPYIAPSSAPTTAEPTTLDPTSDPTSDPTGDPTNDPSSDPTNDPTANPTQEPTTDAPSIKLDEASSEFHFVKHLIVLILCMAAWMN